MAVLSTNESGDDERSSDSVEWTAENEIHLLNALRNRRPVGINRNFQMVFINESFNRLIRREVPSSVLWDHLDDMYDMETLNDNDSPPSPVTEEVEFTLPAEFDELKEQKTQAQADDAAVPSKAAAPAKPTPAPTPKQTKGKAETARKSETRPAKEEGQGDDGQKSAKKKVRPSAAFTSGDKPAATQASSSKKRRN